MQGISGGQEGRGTPRFGEAYAPDFFRKYRAKKASEKPMSMSDTAMHN